MGSNIEELFNKWSQPLSESENARCENASRMIREALSNSAILRNLNLNIFLQGSYKNNTNVREGSDIDVCVCNMNEIFSDFAFAEDITQEDAGLIDSNYTYSQFKDHVYNALVNNFRSNMVIRKNKAINIRENSYHINADVIPAFEHRRYINKSINGVIKYESGTEFISDEGHRIINWPHHNYSNGVNKNIETFKRFKKVVRILKKFAIQLEEERSINKNEIPGYLIECLVWNVPNKLFGNASLTDDVQQVLAYLFNNTMSNDQCSEWGEINEMKYLFRILQPWNRDNAHKFIDKAWEEMGF